MRFSFYRIKWIHKNLHQPHTYIIATQVYHLTSTFFWNSILAWRLHTYFCLNYSHQCFSGKLMGCFRSSLILVLNIFLLIFHQEWRLLYFFIKKKERKSNLGITWAGRTGGRVEPCIVLLLSSTFRGDLRFFSFPPFPPRNYFRAISQLPTSVSPAPLLYLLSNSPLKKKFENFALCLSPRRHNTTFLLPLRASETFVKHNYSRHERATSWLIASSAFLASFSSGVKAEWARKKEAVRSKTGRYNNLLLLSLMLSGIVLLFLLFSPFLLDLTLVLLSATYCSHVF